MNVYIYIIYKYVYIYSVCVCILWYIMHTIYISIYIYVCTTFLSYNTL